MVAPIAANIPSWRMRRWATTTKAAPATSDTSSKAMVSSTSMASATPPTSVLGPASDSAVTRSSETRSWWTVPGGPSS